MHKRWAWLTGVALLSAATAAQASTITFGLDVTFSGTPPSGSPTVTLTDTAAGVEVSISSFPLSGTEFIDDVYLNFTGDVSVLSALYQSGVVANNVSFGSNSFKADGDGYFDILIDYPPPPGNAGTFTADLTSSYVFSLAGINTSMFNASSFCETGCGTGSYFAAAHIQGLAGGLSAWVGDGNGPNPPPPPPPPPPDSVPEPASMVLFGMGMVGAAMRVRKRARR